MIYRSRTTKINLKEAVIFPSKPPENGPRAGYRSRRTGHQHEPLGPTAVYLRVLLLRHGSIRHRPKTFVPLAVCGARRGGSAAGYTFIDVTSSDDPT